jgi:hypothetical protein
MHTNFLQKDVYSAGKQFLVSSSKIMTGGMYFIVVLGLGVFNFISQALVFFSLLYFLITSKSGGVMYQVLDMVPVSDQTRQRCATVLDHAVSSVLLTTTKTMFYQLLSSLVQIWGHLFTSSSYEGFLLKNFQGRMQEG